MRFFRLFDDYKGLPRSVYVLFFASIVNNTGNFVGPFLALFLSGKLGYTAAQTGAFVSACSVLGIFGSLWGGKLIDSIGRKKILVFFQSSSAIWYILCVVFKNAQLIPLFLLLSSFFISVSGPVFNTIINDVTKGEERKAGFSLMYLAMNIGFSVGPLLAGFLYNNFIDFLFLGDALTTFVSIGLVMMFVPETKPTFSDRTSEQNIGSNEKAEEGSLLQALLKRPALIVFSFITILFFLVFSQFTFGLSLQTKQSFGEGGSKIFGILMTTNAVFVAVFTVFITSLTKRMKPALNMALGGLFYAVGFGMMSFINGWFLFVISAVIWTIGEILIATNTSVYMAENTPISHRGRFNSVFPMIRKAGFALGPALAGFYISIFSVRTLWIAVFIVSVLASMLMYMLYMNEKENISTELEV